MSVGRLALQLRVRNNGCHIMPLAINRAKVLQFGSVYFNERPETIALDLRTTLHDNGMQTVWAR